MVNVPAKAVALLLLAGSLLGAEADERAAGEYQVKAAFLYNFAKYVQWPADAPVAQTGTFVITILGHDPFGPSLDETLKGKVIDGLKVVVRRAGSPEDLGASQIVFISDSERGQLPHILKRLEGTATLTVAEMDQFAERGGVIRFRMDGDRVRLDINPGAAARARLKISSELLKLARIVRPAVEG
jgi:uncharacterized protein DUF4154